MSANATLAAAEQTEVPTLTWPTHLAPPFGVEWSRFVGPVPKGYWASARLDSGTGFGVLKLGALPHQRNAPLNIGWFWAGWQRRVSVQLATAFVVDVHCNRVVFNGSGNFVPRCFLSLRPVGGGAEMVNSVQLFGGHSARVMVAAPQSPNLPAAVQYDLSLSLNVRAVYSGTQNPQGELQATITEVQSFFAFPTAAEGAAELAAAPGGAPEPEDGGLDPRELAAALAELGRTAKTYETKSDRDALTAGLVTVGE